MRKDKKRAIELRQKGLSYNVISSQLYIPKSTLSVWLKDLELSKDVLDKMKTANYRKKVDLLVRRNKQQTVLAQERAKVTRDRAKVEARQFMKDPLFILGNSLYWAEGYKKGALGSRWKSVSFANSDPEMISTMMRFFRKYCSVDESRFKFQIMAHENMNIQEAMSFWIKIANSKRENFCLTSLALSKSSKGKLHPNTLTNGTLHIRINNVQLFFRIIGWIDAIKEL